MSVAEYVVSAILVTAQKYREKVKGKSVGIIGAGHVGSEVAHKLKALGMKVFLCDPPLQQAGDSRSFVSYEKALGCDVITLHTPLVKSGEHSTYHLVNEDSLKQLRADQLLINAARGEVVDNKALLNLFKAGKTMPVVLDVWENEPDINLDLLPHLTLATAHIAGHSIEGKAKGTAFVYQRAAKALGLEQSVDWQSLLPPVQQPPFVIQGAVDQASITQCVTQVYDIRKDDQAFREQVKQASDFQYYRKNYPIRREFASMQVKTGNSDGTKALYALGFSPGE
jgi:erythronate-4-phosphate dehydrogenase